ncbi:MAG: hypothetical protein ABIT08_00525, partial [Bacteroidia bacterium]
KELRNSITDSTSTIIGSGLYYLDFKDQRYYSSAGMNPRIGRPAQSFEEAVLSVHANYLVIDRGLIHTIYRGRGKNWTDSMFVFISNKCELISTINENKWNKSSVESNYFPSQLSDKTNENRFLRKINVYRVIGS